MKILITGATGFIGSHCVDGLSRRYRVTTLVRNTDAQKLYHEKGIEAVLGDITLPETLENIPFDIDVVLHAAGILGKWGIDHEAYYNAHVNGTANLLEACVRRNVKRVIYISSAGVLGYSQGGTVLNEDSPYNPQSAYECTKAKAEKYVLEFSRAHALPTVVLRPEFIYGERNEHILGLFKAIKKRCFFVVGKGDTLLHPTYIGDLVQAVQKIIEKQTPSSVYMVAGERYIEVGEFARLIARGMGVASGYIKVPYPLAHGMAHLCESGAYIFNKIRQNSPLLAAGMNGVFCRGKLGFPISRPSPAMAGLVGSASGGSVYEDTPRQTAGRFIMRPVWTHSRLDFFTKNKACCCNRAAVELGYTPIRLEEGLLRTIEWYKEHGCL